MKDIVTAEYVEILVDQFNKLWVNVDGRCVLRIGKVTKSIIADDPVRGRDEVITEKGT